jgi:hypothetical protein
MATGPNPNTDITVPFDGVWNISCFINGSSSETLDDTTNVGGWFRRNGNASNDYILATAVYVSTNCSLNITMFLNAGDYITPYFYWRRNASSITVQRAYFSVSLIH